MKIKESQLREIISESIQRHLFEAVAKERVQVTRDELFDILDKQDKDRQGKFVSFTYVKPVTVKKTRKTLDVDAISGALNAHSDLAGQEWHKSLSDFIRPDSELKNNPIGAIIVVQKYLIHWINKEGYNKGYGEYSDKLTTLRQRYGVARDTAGVLGDNNNQRETSAGVQFNQTGNASRDFNMVGSKVKVTNYIVNDEGHIIAEIPNDIVKLISSPRSNNLVEKAVAEALKDNPEALQEYIAAKQEIVKSFIPKNFVHDKLLAVVATVNGMGYYYINDKLLAPITKNSEVVVNQGEMVKLAEEQLNQSFQDIDAEDFANE